MYAYVSFINSNGVELSGAFVLGYTLSKTKTTHDKIMLCGSNVNANTIYLLQRYFSVIKLDGQANIQSVFTLSYKKIIYLDIDLIILKNLDIIFKDNVPATVYGISGLILLQPQKISDIDAYLLDASKLPFEYNYEFSSAYRKYQTYTIDDIYVINFPDDSKPWNQLITDRFIDEEEATYNALYKKYYKLWFDIYQKIKYKFALSGLELDY